MGAAELDGADPAAHRRARARAGPGARRLAEDLAAAVLELHGEGLERLLAALDDDARAAAGRRRRGEQPAADPRAAPGAAWRSGCSGRSTRCGPTWSRTAGTWSCSESRTGWCGCGWWAAATAARHRRPRSSWRWRRRIQEDGARRARHGRGGRGGAVAGHRHAAAAGRRAERERAPRRPRRLAGARRRGRPRRGRVAPGRAVGQERLLVARVETGLLAYRDACKACGASLRGGGAARGRARLPAPAGAPTSWRGPGARSTATGSSSTRCRCSPTRAPARRVALPS